MRTNFKGRRRRHHHRRYCPPFVCWRTLAFYLTLGLVLVIGAAAHAATGYQKIDPVCERTTVKWVGARLIGQNPQETGSAIIFSNGKTQEDYEYTPALNHSKIGDPIRLCLIATPIGCPPGDERGKIYQATNLRTGEVWIKRDAEHLCGGA